MADRAMASNTKDYVSKRVYDGVRQVTPEESAHYGENVDRAFADMERPNRLDEESGR